MKAVFYFPFISTLSVKLVLYLTDQCGAVCCNIFVMDGFLQEMIWGPCPYWFRFLASDLFEL